MTSHPYEAIPPMTSWRIWFWTNLRWDEKENDMVKDIGGVWLYTTTTHAKSQLLIPYNPSESPIYKLDCTEKDRYQREFDYWPHAFSKTFSDLCVGDSEAKEKIYLQTLGSFFAFPNPVGLFKWVCGTVQTPFFTHEEVNGEKTTEALIDWLKEEMKKMREYNFQKEKEEKNAPTNSL